MRIKAVSSASLSQSAGSISSGTSMTSTIRFAEATAFETITNIFDILINIYIEGEDIRAIPTGKLRERFGVVFQNDTIFEDSIAENVRMGRTLSEEDIKEAITHAKAKEFVEEVGRGYDNHINVRGANLSGGQKQFLKSLPYQEQN